MGGDELHQLGGVRCRHRHETPVAPDLERPEDTHRELSSAGRQVGDVVVAVDETFERRARGRIEGGGEVSYPPVAGATQGQSVHLLSLVEPTGASERERVHQGALPAPASRDLAAGGQLLGELDGGQGIVVSEDRESRQRPVAGGARQLLEGGEVGAGVVGIASA